MFTSKKKYFRIDNNKSISGGYYVNLYSNVFDLI
jgi:hypothetical protein